MSLVDVVYFYLVFFVIEVFMSLLLFQFQNSSDQSGRPSPRNSPATRDLHSLILTVCYFVFECWWWLNKCPCCFSDVSSNIPYCISFQTFCRHRSSHDFESDWTGSSSKSYIEWNLLKFEKISETPLTQLQVKLRGFSLSSFLFHY